MAKIAAKDIRIYLAQYALHGFLNAFDLATKQEVPLVTAFSDAGPRRVIGNYDYKMDIGGFFDGADGQIDTIIAALRGATADQYVSAQPTGNSNGSLSYEALCHLSAEPIAARSGDAVLLSATLEGINQLGRGVVISTAEQTVSGTGAGTGANMGVTTSGQVFAAVVRVLSGTFTSVTVQIRESSDNAAGDPYALISGMSVTRTTAGATRVTTTAATEAWKQHNVSAFAGTSCIIMVTAATMR